MREFDQAFNLWGINVIKLCVSVIVHDICGTAAIWHHSNQLIHHLHKVAQSNFASFLEIERWLNNVCHFCLLKVTFLTVVISSWKETRSLISCRAWWAEMCTYLSKPVIFGNKSLLISHILYWFRKVHAGQRNFISWYLRTFTPNYCADFHFWHAKIPWR